MKNQSSQTFEQLLYELASTLVGHYFWQATDKIYREGGSLHKEYGELFVKAYETIGSGLFPDNPFIDDHDRLNFTKEFLHFCDQTANLTVNSFLFEELEKIKQSQKEFMESKEKLISTLTPLNEKSTPEEAEAYMKEIRDLHKEANKTDGDTPKKFEEFFLKFISVTFTNFADLIKKCDSPLEVAFIVGFLSYATDETLGWSLITNPEHFDGQVNIDKYKIDFVIRDSEEKVKIAIELDGHTYHEKTENQAVNDRTRDRTLIRKGWKLLRFHRREIEQDLEGCIKQVGETYRGR